MDTIDELLIQAAAASRSRTPQLVPTLKVRSGEIDPLGLRQINFDLMDAFLPGLNNVADRVRPFVAISWAWRRIGQLLAKINGAEPDRIQNFVDRIDMVYAWSQFLVHDNPGLAGSEVLAPLVNDPAASFCFDESKQSEWIRMRDTRRTSTGISSPLNYGPGLRSLGWIIGTHAQGLYATPPEVQSALDAFEVSIKDGLDLDLFNELDPVSINSDQVRMLGEFWGVGYQTPTENQVALELLMGPNSPKERRDALALILYSVQKFNSTDHKNVRIRMAEDPDTWLSDPGLIDAARSWRALQVRQLFRLTLEGLFVWLQRQLESEHLSSTEIARRFLDQRDKQMSKTGPTYSRTQNPAMLLEELETLLRSDRSRNWETTPAALFRAIEFCLAFDTNDERWKQTAARSPERLPLYVAKDEYLEWKKLSETQIVENMIDQWVIAQHTYWALGRGLADARSGGKILLRLKVVMGEDGWSLTPGANPRSVPLVTRDRLETAISLLGLCGALD